MPIPKDYLAPHRVSAKERALSELQRWIIDGTLQPGEKLNDMELAEALGLSRTPVREALQLLEVQGFIAMQPGKVTRVTTIEKGDILKIYPPLAALHALAAELAGPLMEPEQIQLLRKLNNEFGEMIKQQQLFKAMEIDEQFHDVIIEMANNPYIASFSATLQMHIRRFKYVLLQQPVSSTITSLDEHEAIIKAFENRWIDKASDAMRMNWLRPMKELSNLI
ncbi:GntR family transcriptional regulator [Ammoniphilus sp. CFH 90114]|uniref:GntR family transcriptional regulator n=1 Tax=Ammoniphilus sp. CFH 90114 TaxID=2493665 RepID=UPI00100E93C1|nr:GntR family transcriptional regulator [Ammoniphilus sp. CFH 90114]RXT06291.1 GntR family transcriptional regulator [Ammoniphilus sp. CFH 90114]